jgi:hypothetical protein
MLKLISAELRHHAPFTLMGAVIGTLIALAAQNLPKEIAHTAFYILHPAHVFLSAVAMTSMYQLHKCTTGHHHCSLWSLLAIGGVGSIGLATLSDSIIPYFAEGLLQMPHRDIHLGFVEKWWVVNPVALAGVLVAYWRPATKVPHAGHVLVSTWASIFHIMMAMGAALTLAQVGGMVVFLFIAVWFPCCLSDIVFPLLFVKDRNAHVPHTH